MPDKRILIVEDEAIVAMTIEDALRGMGYSVVGTESTAEDAIIMAGKVRPDLILMDIRIRGEKDGIAAAEEINGLYHIPIVYLTAHADEKTFQRAMKTHPYGYLIKPFRDRELHSTIEIALYKHRLLLRKIEEQEKPTAADLPSPRAAPAAATKVPKEKPPYPSAFEKTILDLMDYPVFVLDCNLRLVYFNTALERLFRQVGYLSTRKEQSILDSPALSFLGIPQEYREVLETGRTSRLEKVVILNDRKRTFSIKCVPLREKDTIRNVVAILSDISREQGVEQKMLEIHLGCEKILGELNEVSRITGNSTESKTHQIGEIVSRVGIAVKKLDPWWQAKTR